MAERDEQQPQAEERDEQQPKAEERIEDLDVPEEQSDDVKGGLSLNYSKIKFD